MNQYYKLLAATCLVISSFAAKAQCDTVNTVSAVGIGSTSYVISWPAVANAVDYEYAIRIDNQIPAKGTITAHTSVQALGLQPDIVVYICIRTRCSTGLSQWTCQNFKTAPIGTSINSISETKTSVYPNPVTDILNFNFAVNKTHDVTIINSIGAVVGNFTLPAGTTTLNLSQLNPGLYFVKLASENEAQTFKIEKR
ncbi:MAG: T9SS type A sorting domain-containing protein [Flavipsychrobacter sp.]|jgi:hypothetical protein